MIKVYKSFFDYLIENKFPFVLKAREIFYSQDKNQSYYQDIHPVEDVIPEEPWNPPLTAWRQFAGAFNALAALNKDIIQTFKPYKNRGQIWNDLWQPIDGVGNIVKGMAHLVLVPLFYILSSIRGIFYARSIVSYFSRIGREALISGTWILDGVLNMIRGVIQIIASPLGWLIKMPLRGVLSTVNQLPRFEDGVGIERLLASAKVAYSKKQYAHLDAVRHELHRKYKKAEREGQDNITIVSDREASLFDKTKHPYGVVSLEAVNQYFGLFSAKWLAEHPPLPVVLPAAPVLSPPPPPVEVISVSASVESNVVITVKEETSSVVVTPRRRALPAQPQPVAPPQPRASTLLNVGTLFYAVGRESAVSLAYGAGSVISPGAGAAAAVVAAYVLSGKELSFAINSNTVAASDCLHLSEDRSIKP